jgi:phage tail sheath protein FI
MPIAPTYPGVYVEEIPSGVRTITGVATSITAFIGRAARGATDKATVINSFGDFEKIFGGLWTDSYLGYSVRDFFLNGGSQAIVVRLFGGDAAAEEAAKAQLTVGGLSLQAASPGKWGVNLRATVTKNSSPVLDEVAATMGVAVDNLFDLTVSEAGPGGKVEKFMNLTVVESPRRVDRVLAASSDLVGYKGAPTGNETVTAGKDVLGTREQALAEARTTLFETQNQGADTASAEEDVEEAKTALDEALTEAAEALSDGTALAVTDFLPQDGLVNKQGLFALEQVDLFNLLVIPPYKAAAVDPDVDPNLVSAAASYCEQRRAMLLVESPVSWDSKEDAREGFLADPDEVGTRSRNASLFFPRLKQSNPLRDNQVEVFPACGAVAGVVARTDTQRGVWKAPAGMDATLNGVPQLSVPLTDAENGELNPLGINCLRSFPIGGRVVWGARTLRGADQLADEYKYIPVRRTALYIEESLYRGLKWVVFEPNDEPLWAQIRLNVGAFLHNMFRQGAFQGASPKDAYFVKCDNETTTQNDINLGIVNVVVGFAPLKPAEFVIIKLQQMAGQIDV